MAMIFSRVVSEALGLSSTDIAVPLAKSALMSCIFTKVLTIIFSHFDVHATSRQEPPNGECAPEPILDLAAFSGNYSNPGFAYSLQLCTTSNSSDYCKRVLSDYQSLHEDATLKNNLIAYVPGLWLTHLRFVPSPECSTHFRVELSVVYPDGYGANSTAFRTYLAGFGEEVSADVTFERKDGVVSGFRLTIASGEDTYFEKQ